MLQWSERVSHEDCLMTLLEAKWLVLAGSKTRAFAASLLVTRVGNANAASRSEPISEVVSDRLVPI